MRLNWNGVNDIVFVYSLHMSQWQHIHWYASFFSQKVSMVKWFCCNTIIVFSLHLWHKHLATLRSFYKSCDSKTYYFVTKNSFPWIIKMLTLMCPQFLNRFADVSGFTILTINLIYNTAFFFFRYFWFHVSKHLPIFIVPLERNICMSVKWIRSNSVHTPTMNILFALEWWLQPHHDSATAVWSNDINA